ncbi:MAG TPA: hypothetical protein VHL80_07010 [Polyangia bacterium]|nr:hypothetical protein [Polyangia bacterium]
MSRRGSLARLVAPGSLALVGLLALVAEAKVGDAVVAAFKGKIVLSRAAVGEGANDKDTIARLKAAQLTELAGKPGDDGESWTFHYMAFLRKTGNVGLRLQFVSAELDRRLAAEIAIPIPDVDSPVLAGELTVGESRGLSRGKAYLLKLVNDKGEVVAKTSATFK